MSPIRHEISHRAVLWAFWTVVIISVVISTASLWIAHNATKAANVANAALCVEIKYIEGSASLNQQLATASDNPQEQKQRLDAIEGALKLAGQLRSEGVKCNEHKDEDGTTTPHNPSSTQPKQP